MAQTTKIMLVEDDNNLGEIYMARMAAEGYSVVVAHDGEEALALAAKERPDLIISDVMMPKISGFEMLDILRNTPGLRDTKVIMLTALGQAEDKTRAQSLGADRYLVKSQVTLEDIVENARALLAGEAAGTAPIATAAPTPMSAAAPTTAAAAAPAPQPVQSAPSAATPIAADPPQVSAPAPVAEPEEIPVAAPPSADPTPATPAPPAPVVNPGTPAPAADPPVIQGASSAVDPPANTTPPAASEPQSHQTGGLAEPLKADPPASKVESKPESAPPVPPVLPTTPPTTTPTNPPAASPAPAQPPAPAPIPDDIAKQIQAQTPPVPEPKPLNLGEQPAVTNEKALTGAVDELLANAPKSPASTPAPEAKKEEPAPAASDKLSEHGSNKIIDDGGNELAVGDTASTRISGKKVIAPINDVTKKPDLNALLANEEAKATAADVNPSSPGITTSANGLETTVVMPTGNNISDISAPPANHPPANLTEPPPPGQNNPNTPNPSSTSAPGANFDPNSVAL